MRKRALVELKHREGRRVFSVDGEPIPPWRHGQPWLCDGKSCVGVTLLPRQRHPGAIASGLAAFGVDEKRILSCLRGEGGLLEPALLPPVEKHLAWPSEY